MHESLIVRAVRASDFAAWLPLWTGYNEFYGRVGAAALPDKITELTWSRFFDPAEPMHALVAEVDGRLLGLVHFLFHRSTSSATPVCYLADLFTVEAARGAGVGRTLIDAVYNAALAFGSTRVYWHTHETNTVARRLYDGVAENSGFIMYRHDV
jgi:GNAT superfamily N-acetyltransferase